MADLQTSVIYICCQSSHALFDTIITNTQLLYTLHTYQTKAVVNEKFMEKKKQMGGIFIHHHFHRKCWKSKLDFQGVQILALSLVETEPITEVLNSCFVFCFQHPQNKD